MSRKRITRDLRVISCDMDNMDLVVDLFGGPSNACGAVRFTFDDHPSLLRRFERVQSWCDASTPVALVTDSEQIVLMTMERLESDER